MYPHVYWTRKEENTDLGETVGFLELGYGVGADVVPHFFLGFYSSLHQPLGQKGGKCEVRDEPSLKADSETVQRVNPNHLNPVFELAE